MNIILKFKDADTKRKQKGRRKPQQVRQAKARTKKGKEAAQAVLSILSQ